MRGNALTSSSPPMRPFAAATSRHRRPAACSPPNNKSAPPPYGSASIIIARRPARMAVTASAAARVLAPAPPLHRQHRSSLARATAVDGITQPRDQPRLGVGQQRNVLSADTERRAARCAVIKIAADDHDASRLRNAAWPTAAQQSSPTSTSDARAHPDLAAVGSGATSTSTPAAAHSRSMSSRRSGSEVINSGRTSGATRIGIPRQCRDRHARPARSRAAVDWRPKTEVLGDKRPAPRAGTNGPKRRPDVRPMYSAGKGTAPAGGVAGAVHEGSGPGGRAVPVQT